MDLQKKIEQANAGHGWKDLSSVREVAEPRRAFRQGASGGKLSLSERFSGTQVRMVDDLVPKKTVTGTIGNLIGHYNWLTLLGAHAHQNVIFGVGNQSWPVEEDLGQGQWIDPDGLDTVADETLIQIGERPYSLKTLMCYAGLSRRFMKCSSINANNWITDLIARVIARDTITAALVGAGGLQPTGIKNTTGTLVTTYQASSEPPITAISIIDGIGQLEQEKADILSLGIVAAPDIKTALMKQKHSDALWEYDSKSPTGESCMGLPALSIKQMPAGEMCLGDFGRVHVLHGDSIDYTLLTQNSANKHHMYAHHDIDVVIEYPSFMWYRPA